MNSQKYLSILKYQGKCGSCWAFAATGVMEGQLLNLTGDVKPLSEQQLLDCTSSYGNSGCDGGLAMFVFDYAKNHCVTYSTDYPYTEKVSELNFSSDNLQQLNEQLNSSTYRRKLVGMKICQVPCMYPNMKSFLTGMKFPCLWNFIIMDL